MQSETSFIEFNAQYISHLLPMMEDFYAIDGYPFQAALAEKNLNLFLHNPELGRVWMIHYHGEIAGYMIVCFCFSFEFGGRTAFLDELYLKQQYRGKGLGNKAIDFVLEEAKSLGLQAVHLEVEQHNKKGRALYQSKGFKEHSRFLMTGFIDNKR